MKRKIKRVRLSFEDRQRFILDAALKLAASYGYLSVTQRMVAKAAKCSQSLIPYYFGTDKAFRASIMLYAIENKALIVIAQGISGNDPLAVNLPKKLRNEALKEFIK